MVVAASASGDAQASRGREECSNNFPSTFAAIQKVIFESRGCTSAACHDASASGGLDLSAGRRLRQPRRQAGRRPCRAGSRVLVGREGPQPAVPQRRGQDRCPTTSRRRCARCRSASCRRSRPTSSRRCAGGSRSGAPRDGDVAGTADLLDACLPPPKPIEIDPLPPPAAGEGVQLHMPRWIVKTKSESEVCYASYYDFTDQVPEQFRGPNGTFRYKTRADPPGSPQPSPDRQPVRRAPPARTTGVGHVQVPRRRRRTTRSATRPTSASAAPRATAPTRRCKSIACFGQPNLPPDSGLGVNGSGFTGTQEAATTIDLAAGVYGELPLKGMIIWNSHAFNITDERRQARGWLNFYFAPPEEQLFPLARHLRQRPDLHHERPGVPRAGGLQHLPAAAERQALRAQLAHAPARQALADLRRRLAVRRRQPTPARPARRTDRTRPLRRRTSAPARPAVRCCRRAAATATPTWSSPSTSW